ncbi:MAG: 6-phosphogluconolactonase [Myxococcales bacterium]|nr:6-phosphogluconolactonase [Myxococcales bacterium]
MRTLRRFPTSEALYDGAADEVVALLAGAHAARGRASLALAGGSTPRGLYERLAGPLRALQVDWSRTYVYFGDERCVPADSPTSNFRMASEALLSKVPLPASRVFRIEGELAPKIAAARYGAVLSAAPPLDLVLLGMGDDGHTASIFPDTPELDSPGAMSGARVVATRSPIDPADRVSLSLRSINEAGHVVFLVSGASKAARLAQVFEQRLAYRTTGARPTLPAALVHPQSLTFLVDEAAARYIPFGSSP